jgi:ribosomal protein S20
LVAPDKSSWENKKSEFKNLATNLLQNIESDDYDDASGEITKAITILKNWKNRIDKNISDGAINENSQQPNADQYIKHHIDEEFLVYIIPGSSKFTLFSDEDGTYSVETKLAIPKKYFPDLKTAKDETSKQLSFNNYSGPGQSWSRSYVSADGEDSNSYILTFAISGGYDI